jgi:hypothetical protein
MLLLSSLFTKLKKNIFQLLLIFAVFYGLYWYYENSQQEIKDATEKVETLEGDNKKLVGEVKDLKEQSPIDIKTASDHQKDQGDLELVQTVAIEKVQHEVKKVLQEAPVEDRDSKSTADSVSGAVVDGMWDSYNGSVRGGTGKTSKAPK